MLPHGKNTRNKSIETRDGPTELALVTLGLVSGKMTSRRRTKTVECTTLLERYVPRETNGLMEKDDCGSRVKGGLISYLFFSFEYHLSTDYLGRHRRHPCTSHDAQRTWRIFKHVQCLFRIQSRGTH